MTDEKKVETKIELIELKFKKSTFVNKKGITMPLLEKYSGNGFAADDGETIQVEAELATKMLYNLPDNFEMVSKGKAADDVAHKAKAHVDNRTKRQKIAKKEEDDKLAKLKGEQNKAGFSR